MEKENVLQVRVEEGRGKASHPSCALTRQPHRVYARTEKKQTVSRLALAHDLRFCCVSAVWKVGFDLEWQLLMNGCSQQVAFGVFHFVGSQISAGSRSHRNTSFAPCLPHESGSFLALFPCPNSPQQSRPPTSQTLAVSTLSRPYPSLAPSLSLSPWASSCIPAAGSLPGTGHRPRRFS